jgi:polysaccharide pyruvyl transferase WcaK-like protein
MLVAPFGFYGWGNIGDESTLQGFARLVSRQRRKLRVWVASRSPEHTARVEPRFRYFRAEGRDLRGWWARRRARAYVVAGGTPIMDLLGPWPLSEVAPLVEAARDARKPMVFVGAGVERLERAESRDLFARRIAPSVRHWTVRSPRDGQRLLDYGVAPERVRVAADLAWLLDGASTAWGGACLRDLGVPADGPVVGVNVTNERFVRERAPGIFARLAAALDSLVDRHRARVVFLCNEVRNGETFDRVASERIRGGMRRAERAWLVPNRYWTPEQMMSLVGACRLVVGMRYHFCVFAALQGVPFVALERSDKVADLRWDMDWPYGLPLEGLSGGALLGMVDEILADGGQAAAQSLAARVRSMRERALTNASALEALANGAPRPPAEAQGR